MTELIHLRHDGAWALPACITPSQSYAYGRAQDPTTIGQAVKVRMERTTTEDASRVTCPKCLEIMAKEVELLLDPPAAPADHGALSSYQGTGWKR